MNLKVSFEAVTSSPQLQHLRCAFRESLPEPHAPLLSALAEDAEFHLVHCKDGVCGYLALTPDGSLIEFYLDEPYWVFGEVVATQALSALSIRRAVVQQYDALLLSSLIAHQRSVRSLGLLVRDFVQRPLPSLPGIEFTSRVAAADDLPRIQTIEQDVFTHPERMRAVVAAGDLVLYERGEALVGFGIMRPIGESGAVELGIAVARAFRARGYAVYIFKAMIDHCHARGRRPVAGCAEDNRPSRYMGERAGFVARHRMLELTF